MKPTTKQILSVVLFAISAVLEVGVRTEFINPESFLTISGITLALLLVGLGLNVSIIRKMGVPDPIKKRSQIIGIALSAYALLLYVILP